MIKTFFSSPLAGIVAACIGWFGAVLLTDAMDPVTLAELQFGWHGILVGCVAAMFLVVFFAVGSEVEPLVMLLPTIGLTAYFWDRTQFPREIETTLGRSTPTYYWATLTMMALVLGLLILGLRISRYSNGR